MCHCTKQADCEVGVVIVMCHCTKQAGCEVGVVILMCHCTKQAGCEVGVVIVMCHCTKQAGYEVGVVVAIQSVQRPRVLYLRDREERGGEPRWWCNQAVCMCSIHIDTLAAGVAVGSSAPTPHPPTPP